MNLKQLNDKELLARTKQLVCQERELLTQILHHMREVERRKLYSDLHCKSLFDYCVKVLNYSESQAQRRIQAMRILKELPQVEEKITSGKLNLSNIAQAQSCFREVAKSNKEMTSQEKLEVLAKLENQSAREGQRILSEIQPQEHPSKDKQKWISSTQLQTTLVLSQDILNKLEQVRSLLGLKGVQMELDELISCMADLSCENLKVKKFGKKRIIIKKSAAFSSPHNGEISAGGSPSAQSKENAGSFATPLSQPNRNTGAGGTPLSQPNGTSSGGTLSSRPNEPAGVGADPKSATSTKHCGKNSRYVSKELQHHVWARDCGKCTQCGSQRNLNYDHIKPIAFGGESTAENLRLLCFHCNQRQAMKTFGIQPYF